jgi:plastocyanin
MLLTPSALRRAGLLTLAIAAVVALAACSSSDASEPASSTDQGGGTATVTDGAVTITADNLAFDASVIQAPAGEDFTITLVNNDSAPHNISIYTEEGGELIGSAGATAEGDQTVTIDVSALDAGTYYFQCDIHPDMNGSVEVSA